MESLEGTDLQSVSYGDKTMQIDVENCQFGQDFENLIMAPVTGNSFTALLELPSTQAMELLHSPPETEVSPGGSGGGGDLLKRRRVSAFNHALHGSSLPSNRALIERAAKFSVFAMEDSPETSNSIADLMKVKPEPIDNESEKSTKRKEREKKVKSSNKKTKTAAITRSEDREKLPYVHVRARRGQATDNHSLAERARREKINARMKLLQELVPGCNKISGTALVLDEIINHVQSLQRQVEYLSMRLAAVNPRVDFSLDNLISAGTESSIDCSFNFSNMAMPLMWPEFNVNGDRQQIQQQWQFGSLNRPMWIKEENHHNLVASENSLLSYDSPANSASFHSSQLKMEQ